VALMGREDQRRQEVRMEGEGEGMLPRSETQAVKGVKRPPDPWGKRQLLNSSRPNPAQRGRTEEFPNTFLGSEPGSPLPLLAVSTAPARPGLTT
jgi:hypothetical protein